MSQETLQSTKRYKRIIQIELNEISRPVVDALIAKGELPNFAKMNKEWLYLKTTSEKDYDKLEPWIQWTSAHTGKTYEEHQIFRLSDVHKLEHIQIWEELSQLGIESGIIGSMNAIRRDTEKGIFFPDPWAQENDAYPENLKPLWDLISSRVQGHATSKIGAADMMKGAKTCLQFGLPLSIYFKILNQLLSQKANPKNRWKLAGVFDVFLAEIFKSVLKSTNFGFYTLFLNAVAHYQHHYWRSFDGKDFDQSIKYDDIEDSHDPMTYGYKMYDRILGQVFKQIGNDKDTLVVVCSGLSQVPYTDKEAQGGMNYYRLKDHKQFAQSIGLQNCEIFPLMSRDWQVKYTDEASRVKALELLQGLKTKGEALFNIKENTPGYIFLETDYTKGMDANQSITNAAGEHVVNFDDVFVNIAIKSGHHTGIGNLWLSDNSIGLKEGTKVPLTSLYQFTIESLSDKKVVEEVA